MYDSPLAAKCRRQVRGGARLNHPLCDLLALLPFLPFLPVALLPHRAIRFAAIAHMLLSFLSGHDLSGCCPVASATKAPRWLKSESRGWRAWGVLLRRGRASSRPGTSCARYMSSPRLAANSGTRRRRARQNVHALWVSKSSAASVWRVSGVGAAQPRAPRTCRGAPRRPRGLSNAAFRLPLLESFLFPIRASRSAGLRTPARHGPGRVVVGGATCSRLALVVLAVRVRPRDDPAPWVAERQHRRHLRS